MEVYWASCGIEDRPLLRRIAKMRYTFQVRGGNQSVTLNIAYGWEFAIDLVNEQSTKLCQVLGLQWLVSVLNKA
jgi:hypothetical protein